MRLITGCKDATYQQGYRASWSIAQWYVCAVIKGDSFYVPPNTVHGAVCIEEGELIDVFSPIREDFME